MDGEMDWIAARFLLSTILGVHPLAVLDDGGRDEEHFPVDGGLGGGSGQQRVVVVVPAAVEAPEGVAGVSVCAVCTEEVAAGQAVVRLPCAHWYHAGCIAPWLRIRTTCPTCRAELPTEAGAGARAPMPPAAAARAAARMAEPAGGRLRREASYTMLAGPTYGHGPQTLELLAIKTTRLPGTCEYPQLCFLPNSLNQLMSARRMPVEKPCVSFLPNAP